MKYPFQLCAFADEASENIDEQITALKDNAISQIEMRNVDGSNISKITIEKAQEVRTKLDCAGISVWALGAPTGKISIADDFVPHFDEFRRLLELGEIVGASHFRLFSFYGSTASVKAGAAAKTTVRDTVIERLSRLVDAAKGSGMVLCHENEKDIYGETALGCLEIHRALPELKAVFDPANFIQAGQDTFNAWDMLEPYVEYMHIKDAKADGTVVPAGQGDANIRELLEKYGEKGGTVLTLEPHLFEFTGLSDLEHETKSGVGAYAYVDSRAAFDAGVSALMELISEA